MGIAYAGDGSTGGNILAFLPLLLMGCVLGFLYRAIAKRKGRNEWLWFLAGFVPVWNLLGGLWLASLQDRAVTDDIKALIEELQKVDFAPKVVQTISNSTAPQTWRCNCGQANGMSILSCPECGLKRDYLLRHTSPA